MINSAPYISFILNENGWNIFWLECVPNIVTNISVDIEEYEDPTFGKINSEIHSMCVNINSYYDFQNNIDNCFITIRGNHSEEGNKIFWELIKENFKKLK